jgi:hypothetical protein
VPSWARAAVLPPEANPREDSVVVLWNQALLQGVRESKLGPPMVARALAVAHTCAYDAWAAYDRDAVATQVGGALRRSPAERTLANKQKAISFATYRAALDLFPGSKQHFDDLMSELGYDPSETSGAAGVGITCAQAVIDFRHDDNSNQLEGYADTTGYTPANEPMDLTKPFDRDTVHDPNRWQPLTYVDASGIPVTPKFIGPHWKNVLPFATPPAVSDRGPAKYGTQACTSTRRRP